MVTPNCTARQFSEHGSPSHARVELPAVGPNRTKRGRTIPPDDRARARALAIELVAGDYVKDHEIAARCGISRRTLGYWKTEPDFIAAVNQVRRAYAEEQRAIALQKWRR